MIVAEERLDEAFSQLPEIDGFKPTFDWGNKYHLIKVLKAFEDEKKSPYPLIYQLSNDWEQTPVKNIVSGRPRFVIACRNEMTELLNRNRWAMSYRSVLYPVVVNIEKMILRAGIFDALPRYRMYNHPNYGNNGNENFTTDIWDAVEIEFLDDLVINNACINHNIKF